VNKTILSIILVFFAFPCGASQAATSDADENVAEAKAAIKQLAGSLKKELKASIQTGGPVAAIGVCNTQAMPITDQVATELGLQVSRVSLKNRNPVNAANGWQTAVLEDFERQKSAGKDINKITWTETVNVEGGQEFRFMKAMPTGPVCLMCHGTHIAPEVTQVIAELYPEDKATGYSEGDIRGAFVVTRTLE
jgi:hypothetical protein